MPIDDALASALHKAALETLDAEAYELYKRDYINCVYDDGYSFLTELNWADAYFTPDTVGVILPCKLALNMYYELEIPYTPIEEEPRP